MYIGEGLFHYTDFIIAIFDFVCIILKYLNFINTSTGIPVLSTYCYIYNWFFDVSLMRLLLFI